MDIIIQSPGFKASEQLDLFIREKVSSLKADNIVRANVTLLLGPESENENKVCEIRLEVPGNDHFVKKQTLYFETSVSECVDILSQKIKKTRDKDINKRHAEATTIQDVALAANEEEIEPDLEDVVK